MSACRRPSSRQPEVAVPLPAPVATGGHVPRPINWEFLKHMVISSKNSSKHKLDIVVSLMTQLYLAKLQACICLAHVGMHQSVE